MQSNNLFIWFSLYNHVKFILIIPSRWFLFLAAIPHCPDTFQSALIVTPIYLYYECPAWLFCFFLWPTLVKRVHWHKYTPTLLGLWLRLECSLDSLSIDSAHVIYVSEGYDVAYNRRTASQPSYVVLRVTWYVKTFQKRQLRVLNPARINVFYWFNWLNLIGS